MGLAFEHLFGVLLFAAGLSIVLFALVLAPDFFGGLLGKRAPAAGANQASGAAALSFPESSEPERSLEFLEAAVARNPGDARAQKDLGYAYGKRQRWVDALTCYQKVVQLLPDSFIGHLCVGIAFAKLNRPVDAIAAYEESSRLKPDFAETYGSLGDALCTMKRYREGCDAYRKAVELKPTFKQAIYSLGMAAMEIDDWQTNQKCTMDLLRTDLQMALELIARYNFWADQQKAKGMTNLPKAIDPR